MKMKRYASFDDYFVDQSPKNRSVIRALTERFLGLEPKCRQKLPIYCCPAYRPGNISFDKYLVLNIPLVYFNGR
jgi:hypothetical protein